MSSQNHGDYIESNYIIKGVKNNSWRDLAIYVEKNNVSYHFNECVIPKMYTGQRGPNLEYFFALNRAILNVQGCIKKL